MEGRAITEADEPFVVKTKLVDSRRCVWVSRWFNWSVISSPSKVIKLRLRVEATSS